MTTIPQSADPETSFTATWDAWNRLVKLLDDDTAATVAEYQYDVTNRRILKKLYASGVLDQTRHIYLSSSNQVLEERVDAGTAASMQNIWGLMYIDGLVLRDRDTDGNGTLDERLYCLQDGNWNAVALVDTSGDVTQRFCYQPFGACEFLGTTYSPGTNDFEWITLFTGRDLDRESGLHYFRARYFDPKTGAFLSRDPIQYESGRNLYAAMFYVTFTDPDGLQPELVPSQLPAARPCQLRIAPWSYPPPRTPVPAPQIPQPSLRYTLPLSLQGMPFNPRSTGHGADRMPGKYPNPKDDCPTTKESCESVFGKDMPRCDLETFCYSSPNLACQACNLDTGYRAQNAEPTTTYGLKNAFHYSCYKKKGAPKGVSIFCGICCIDTGGKARLVTRCKCAFPEGPFSEYY